MIQIKINDVIREFKDYDLAIDFLKKTETDENKDAFLYLINNNEKLKEYLTNNSFRLFIGEQRYSSYKGMTEGYDECFSDSESMRELESYGVILTISEAEIIDNVFFNNSYDDDESYPVIYSFYAVFTEDFSEYTIVVEDEENY